GSNSGFTAGPGYDLVTGRGTPLAQRVAANLAGEHFALDQLISSSIATAGETDRYYFTGQAGRTVTVSAYWGSDGANDGGLLDSGQLRLFGPTGSALTTPADLASGAAHYSVLDGFTLPADGIYYVEVSRTGAGTGNYWLGI